MGHVIIHIKKIEIWYGIISDEALVGLWDNFITHPNIQYYISYIRENPKNYNNHEGPTSTLKKKLTIPGPLYATNPNNVTVPIISKSLKITSNTCIKFDPTKMGTPPKIDMTMEKNCYLKMDSVIFH